MSKIMHARKVQAVPARPQFAYILTHCIYVRGANLLKTAKNTGSSGDRNAVRAE